MRPLSKHITSAKEEHLVAKENSCIQPTPSIVGRRWRWMFYTFPNWVPCQLHTFSRIYSHVPTAFEAFTFVALVSISPFYYHLQASAKPSLFPSPSLFQALRFPTLIVSATSDCPHSSPSIHCPASIGRHPLPESIAHGRCPCRLPPSIPKYPSPFIDPPCSLQAASGQTPPDTSADLPVMALVKPV